MFDNSILKQNRMALLLVGAVVAGLIGGCDAVSTTPDTLSEDEFNDTVRDSRPEVNTDETFRIRFGESTMIRADEAATFSDPGAFSFEFCGLDTSEEAQELVVPGSLDCASGDSLTLSAKPFTTDLGKIAATDTVKVNVIVRFTGQDNKTALSDSAQISVKVNRPGEVELFDNSRGAIAPADTIVIDASTSIQTWSVRNPGDEPVSWTIEKIPGTAEIIDAFDPASGQDLGAGDSTTLTVSFNLNGGAERKSLFRIVGSGSVGTSIDDYIIAQRVVVPDIASVVFESRPGSEMMYGPLSNAVERGIPSLFTICGEGFIEPFNSTIELTNQGTGESESIFSVTSATGCEGFVANVDVSASQQVNAELSLSIINSGPELGDTSDQWETSILVVDNFGPAIPANFGVLLDQAQVHLDVSWCESESEDVAQYKLLRTEEGLPDTLTFNVDQLLRISDTGCPTDAKLKFLDRGNLIAGEDYAYRVFGVDDQGNVGAETSEQSQIFAVYPAPQWVDTPDSVMSTPGSLTLNWNHLTVVPSGLGGIEDYLVFRDTDPAFDPDLPSTVDPGLEIGGNFIGFVDIDMNPCTTCTYTDSGLESNTTYYYKIVASAFMGNDRINGLPSEVRSGSPD